MTKAVETTKETRFLYALCAAEAPLNGSDGSLRSIIHTMSQHVSATCKAHPGAEPLGGPVLIHAPAPLGGTKVVAIQAVYRPGPHE